MGNNNENDTYNRPMKLTTRKRDGVLLGKGEEQRHREMGW
jgi:hypothetical protein